jgi:FkbM family methyltransferase
LRRNLSINDCQVNVAVEQVAIAYDGAPTVAFSLGETSVSGRIDNTATGLQRIEVPARTVSALVASHDLRDFSLVSDIEGVEWQILRKDRDCLAKARLIIMETHDNPVFGRWTDLIEALTGTGLFRLIDRHGPVVVLAGAGYPG